VTRHLLYLIVRGARNNLLRQLRRLRNPRYAIALLFGLGYFFLVFGGMQDAETRQEVSGITVTAARGIGPLLLALVAAWWWLWGGFRSAILLTPAETHLLLPAPITRRELVRYKLMSAQAGILFSALMGTLVTHGAPLPFPLRFLGLWVMVATLHMHQTAASLVHAAAQEQGRHGLRRNLVPLVLFSAAVVTLAVALLRAIADIRRAPGFELAVQRIGAMMTETGPMIVLAPFRAIVAPAVAATTSQWLPAFGIACALLVLHYVWVLRTDAAFEEVAAEEGEKQAARIAAVRSGGLSRLRFTRTDRPKKLAQPWLPLRPTGRPAYAVTWKNVLLAQRSVRIVAVMIPVAVLVMMMLAMGGDVAGSAREAGFMLLGLAALATIAGPLAVRLDLRVDLGYLDLLRTYPVSGRDMVAAGVLASGLVVSGTQLLFGLPGIALLAVGGVLTPLDALGAGTALVLVAPAVTGLGITIQNAIALLYPSWSRIGEARTGGIEAVGSNMLSMIGTVVMLVLALIPALLIAGIVGGATWLVLHELAIIPALAAAVLVVAGEVVLGVMWLGRLYDTTDPVEAGLLLR